MFLRSLLNSLNSYLFIISKHTQDNNGTIENEELRGFLKDLLELVKKVTNRKPLITTT